MVGIAKSRTTPAENTRSGDSFATATRAIARCLERQSELHGFAQMALNIMEAELGYEFGAVLVIRPESRRLEPVALSEQGRGPDFVEQDRAYVSGHGIDCGSGITGWVGASGRVARVGDVRRDRRYRPMRSSVRAELCVPIRAAARSLGVLNVESPEPNAFDEGDERRLTAVAAQLALILQTRAIRATVDRGGDTSREVDHRLRNSLAAVGALVDVCLHTHAAEAERAASITRRLHALTVVHDLLTRRRWQAIDLHELVRSLGPAAGDRFFVQGPPVTIPLRQVPAFGLVIHELASNCRRHGALRTPWGEAGVRWTAEAGEPCRVQWIERGPRIDGTDPGGGTSLTNGLMRSELRGGIAWGYRPDGVHHELWADLDDDER
ncbi:MAG: GAF domain-containing protein [Phycisphaerae bacterium]|nr:GAF domain-containing protein [Phycisphaerae bacterium]